MRDLVSTEVTAPVRPGMGVWKPPLSRIGVSFAVLFAFICFFPNPALPIGESTGLQASQILALVFVPLMLVIGFPKRQSLALLLIVLPILASSFYAVFSGNALADDVVLKAAIEMPLALAVLLPAGWLICKGYKLHLLYGVAMGVTATALIGAYQLYGFWNNTFPLFGLLQNPSFGTFIQDLEYEWPLYVKRPFGLFPEPSAMTASIGPWIVLIAGVLLYPRSMRGVPPWAKALMAVAVIGGLALVVASRSGYTLPLMASLLLLSSPKVGALLAQIYRPKNLIFFVVVSVIGTVAIIAAFTYLGSRLDAQNDSWQDRGTSIIWGISYLGTDLSTLLFGVGPGQSFEILEQAGSVDSLAAGSAVWSVVVLYMQEMGGLGTLVLLLLFWIMVRSILRSSARLIGFSGLAAWLSGVILTTSYVPLSPIWLFMGILLAWDQAFESRTLPTTNVVHVDTPEARRKVKA